MKLTRTDAVFSRTTMVLFLCRNKSSRGGTKLCKDFLYNNKEFLEPRTMEGAPGWAQPTRARHPLQARSGGLSPPGGPTDPEADAIKSYFSIKNQGERIIAIHETDPPSPPVLHREVRSGVHLGLQRGDLRSSSSPTFLHCQSMMLPTGSE